MCEITKQFNIPLNIVSSFIKRNDTIKMFSDKNMDIKEDGTLFGYGQIFVKMVFSVPR